MAQAFPPGLVVHLPWGASAKQTIFYPSRPLAHHGLPERSLLQAKPAAFVAEQCCV
jgi:hypothetical protein